MAVRIVKALSLFLTLTSAPSSVFVFYLSLQEYLVVKIFEREFGLFMTFLQFFGYAACAALRRGIHRETGRKIPLPTYFGLGFLQVCSIVGVTSGEFQSEFQAHTIRMKHRR